MSKKSDKQVVTDEADAETRYLKSLDDAIQAAKAVAVDQARKESERVAAAQAADALTEVEMARTYASEAEPEVAAKTFTQSMREWLQGR